MDAAANLSPGKRWFISLRPYSFTASLMPVALAAAIAVGNGGPVAWWTFPLYAVAALLFHAGTNVLNDYFDYIHGVDGPEDEDPTHAITQGIVSPRFMAITGHLYFAVGVVVGGGIAVERGGWFFLAGLAGAVGAYFYTNARFSFKYVALGDLLVFLLMGPALVVMGEWALLGEAGAEAVYHALPMGLLVTAILHGNNLRNIETDRRAGVTTVATLLGPQRSRGVFYLLLIAPFPTVIGYVVGGLAPAPLLATLVAGYPAVKLLRTVAGASSARELMTLPLQTAQLHLLFSLLYILPLLLTGILL